ncbi:MAG TPA: hypothetical protein VNJ08_08510 [Bacteriovoracaceae bacterium]|nr:hypothetical protein [Bacteriovoracaceae bacterium]
MKILIIIAFLIMCVPSWATEVIYPGKFKVTLTEQYFSYSDSFFKERVLVQKCNLDIFKSAMALFNIPDKKGLLPRPIIGKKIKFQLDNKNIEVSPGSQVHVNLEAFPKTVHGYFSRARSKCSP